MHRVLMYYGAYCDIDSTGIFIRPVWSIGNVAKEHIDISFRQQQPVSLLRENMCRLHTHLVSVKYDGVRVAACFMEVEGIPICMLYGKRCRRIRCVRTLLRKVDPCVLDAELMDDGTVVAFDIIQHNNRYLAESPFQYRVDLLNTLQLPKVHGKDVVVKQFWPAASVNLALEKMADVASDGLVFHSPHALLRDSGTMHKWKPRHTVDLKVAGNMRLRTRLATVQSLDPRYHEQCKKDEIWEFEFNTEGNFKLVPAQARRQGHAKRRPDLQRRQEGSRTKHHHPGTDTSTELRVFNKIEGEVKGWQTLHRHSCAWPIIVYSTIWNQ